MVRLGSQHDAVTREDTLPEEPPIRTIPRSTQWAREHDRQRMQQKAAQHRYATAEEDRILCLEAAQMFNLDSKTILAK